MPRIYPKKKHCSMPDCEAVATARGLCPKHYTRWVRHGDPSVAERKFTAPRASNGMGLAERLAAKSERLPNGCLVWSGFLTRGYGRIHVDGQSRLVHHAAWFLAFGEWPPDGLTLDHTCHNADEGCNRGVECEHRACMEVAHLRLVTATENTLAGRGPMAVNARKTHCPRGHPLSGENLVVEASTGRRRCRVCSRATKERWKQAHKSASTVSA